MQHLAGVIPGGAGWPPRCTAGCIPWPHAAAALDPPSQSASPAPERVPQSLPACTHTRHLAQQKKFAGKNCNILCKHDSCLLLQTACKVMLAAGQSSAGVAHLKGAGILWTSTRLSLLELQLGPLDGHGQHREQVCQGLRTRLSGPFRRLCVQHMNKRLDRAKLAASGACVSVACLTGGKSSLQKEKSLWLAALRATN